jgi:hypothetical protein
MTKDGILSCWRRTIACDEGQPILAHSCEFEIEELDCIQQSFLPCYGEHRPIPDRCALGRGCHLEIWAGKHEGAVRTMRKERWTTHNPALQGVGRRQKRGDRCKKGIAGSA